MEEEKEMGYYFVFLTECNKEYENYRYKLVQRPVRIPQIIRWIKGETPQEVFSFTDKMCN